MNRMSAQLTTRRYLNWKKEENMKIGRLILGIIFSSHFGNQFLNVTINIDGERCQCRLPDRCSEDFEAEDQMIVIK